MNLTKSIEMSKPCRCLHCDKKFESEEEIAAHIAQEHLFDCQNCSRSLRSEEELDIHSILFHKCTVCSFRSSSTQVILSHIKENHPHEEQKLAKMRLENLEKKRNKRKMKKMKESSLLK